MFDFLDIYTENLLLISPYDFFKEIQYENKKSTYFQNVH